MSADAIRFFDKVRLGYACWHWTAQTDRDGYGMVKMNGKPVRAHRWSYEYFHGDIPEGLCVLHACDNPPCTNPKHLFIGSHQDNMTDMMRKGRSTAGEASASSKLTEADVHKIRASKATQQALADEYGVDRSIISRIMTRKMWKHV